MTRVGNGDCLTRNSRSGRGLKFLKQSSRISTTSEPISFAFCISISIWSTVVPINGVHSNVGLLRPPVLLVCKPDTVNYNRTKRNVHVFIEHACMELVNKQRAKKEEENASTYRKASHDEGVVLVLQLWVEFAVCCSSVRTSRRSRFKSWLFMEDRGDGRLSETICYAWKKVM